MSSFSFATLNVYADICSEMGSPAFKPNQGEQTGSQHLLYAKHLVDTLSFSFPCKARKSTPNLEMSQWELREVKSVAQDHRANKRVTASQRVFPLVRDSPGHTAWQPDFQPACSWVRKHPCFAVGPSCCQTS